MVDVYKHWQISRCPPIFERDSCLGAVNLNEKYGNDSYFFNDGCYTSSVSSL